MMSAQAIMQKMAPVLAKVQAELMESWQPLVIFLVLSMSDAITLHICGATSSFTKYWGRDVYVLSLILAPVFLRCAIVKFYFTIAYVLACLFVSVNAVHCSIYGAPVASFIVQIAQETNSSEVFEFVAQFFGIREYLLSGVLFVVTAPLLYSWLKKENRINKGALSASIIFLIFFSVGCAKHGVKTVVRWNYALDMVASVATYSDYVEEFNNSVIEADLPKGVTLSPRFANGVTVIIIGEGASRHHMGAYGYERDTTPFMSALGSRGVLFQDVISPHGHTTTSLMKCLTFSDHEGHAPRCSVVDVFNEAGVETFLYSNQMQFGVYETSTSLLMRNVDNAKYYNKGNVDGFYGYEVLDEDMIPDLVKRIEQGGPAVLFVHLMGSHAAYDRRYPKEYDYFSDSTLPAYANKLSASKKETINAYDNSIRYTDAFLEQVCEAIEKQSFPASVLYFSDHGQVLYEDGVTRGHSESSRYGVDIPLCVYANEAFSLKHKSLFARIKNAGSRPWQTDDLIYSLLSLSGISFDGADQTQDVFSSSFAREKRIMGKVDYDESLASQG